MSILTNFWIRLKKRLAPFVDMTAWVLVLVSLIPLWIIDNATALTLIQWTAYGLALAGISVVICRVVFPQIDLKVYLREAKDAENIAAAIVVLGVCIFLSFVLLSLTLWAKA